MELRHLRYFTAVAEDLHFSRAARRLRVAQPALSKQVRDLEGELGVALFVRQRQRITLTAAGESFLRDARAILAAADRAVVGARRAAHGQTGCLRLGYMAALAPPCFSPTLRTLRQAHPAAELSLHDLPPDRQIGDLLEGKLDVGFFTHLAAAEVPAELELLPVATHAVAAVLPTGHRLFEEGSRPTNPLPLRTLAEEPFVLFSAALKPVFHRWLLAQCGQAGFTPRVAQHVEHAEALLDLVAAGVGISLAIPLDAWRVRRDLSFRVVTEPSPRIEHFAARRHGVDEHRPLAAALFSTLRKVRSLDEAGEDTRLSESPRPLARTS